MKKRINIKHKKIISFILSFCICISILNPIFGLFTFNAVAETYYGRGTLDGSSGPESDEWTKTDPLNSAGQSDLRYASYPEGFTLGDATTPYIIKNGDELAYLSVLVNSGTSFENKYIDIQGLTAADLAQTDPNNNNEYIYDETCVTATVDLRPYDGSSQYATGTLKWTAIGTSTNPFKGKIYSSVNAKIINFTYNTIYTINDNCYGLFGYNEGTIGIKPDSSDGGFSVVATEEATEEGCPKQLNLNSSQISVFGGVVAVNNGTVNAVSFNGIINLPAIIASAASPSKFGGVVGYSTGNVTKCSFVDNENTQAFIGWSQNSADSSLVRTFNGTDIYAFNLGGVVGSSLSLSGNIKLISGCNSYADIELPDTKITTLTPSVAGGVVGYCVLSTITNCNYYGNILSLGEITTVVTTRDAVNGIGGIVGYSTGALSYCISNSNIYFNSTETLQVGDYIKVGGIAGSKSVNTTTYCVFLGSISANGKCDNESSFGGIVGYANASANTTNCISVANIERYTTTTNGGTGGIAGISSASVTYCFSAGYIGGSDLAGGIAGSTSYEGKYNYSTASLNGDDGTTSLRIGGLYGLLNNKMSNSYFAGSSLKSYVSSLADSTNQSSFTNVYYDASISPNRVDNGAKITTDNYARNTSSLINAFSADTTNWITTTTNYPQLKWAAQTIDSDSNATSDFKSLVKALSNITTATYITVNDTNAVKNDNSNTYKLLNAYQFYDLQNTSGYLNEPAFTVQNGSASVTAWNAIETYKNYSINPIGYTWEKDITITVNGTQFNSIRILRKTLEAANKTEGASTGDATKITSANFFTFLDVFCFASGAYAGGVYTVTENIDASSNQITNMTPKENYFCSELVGNNYTISNITYADNAYAVFGNINKRGNAHDLIIDNAVIGSAASPFTTTNTKIGLFFGYLYGAVVTNLDVTNFSMCMKDLTSVPEIGLIVATLSTPSATIANCDVRNAYFEIGSYDGTYSSRAMNRVANMGSAFGSLTSANIENCDASDISMLFNIYETYSSSGVGGLAGRTSTAGYGLNNCEVRGNIEFLNTFATDRSLCGGIVGNLQRNTCKNSSFVGNIKNGGFLGGITAFVDNMNGSIENCYVIGNLTSQSQRAANYAGGIAGRVDNNANAVISKSYYIGNITAPMAGGIIGYTSLATITDCYANSIVYANGTTSATYAGGLVGQKYNTTSLSINNSYFTGQVQGGGNSGGLVGLDSDTGTSVTISNSYYDRGVAGYSLFAIGNKTNLYTDCDIDTKALASASLGSSFQLNSTTNYPQIISFYNSSDSIIKSHSDYSTRIVFDNDNSTYLLGGPGFILNETGGQISVTKNETQIGTNPITLYDWRNILQVIDLKYTLTASGNTLFTVNYEAIEDYKTVTFTLGSLPVDNSDILSLPYQIICKPFEYGSGTQSDPYIIYDLNQLIKFKNFLDAGFDKSGIYYKIGSVSFDEYGNGTIVGDPITIDLSMQDGNASTVDEWEPIFNFAGNLDGNESVIKNLNCTTGKTITNTDNTTVSYYGLFGTCAASAVCKNLTISNTGSTAAITCSKSTSRIGALIADSSGGTFSGIKVQDLNFITASSYAYIGGVIGYASGGGLTALSVSDCTTVFTAKSNNTNTNNYAGGIIGYLSGITANVQNCTTYGTMTSFYNSGGIISTIGSTGSAAITNCGSTVDITTTVSGAYAGGIIGLVTFANIDSSYLKLTDVFYGGRIDSSSSTTNVGSLVAMYYKTVALNSSSNPFPSQADASIYTNEYVTTPFNTVDDLQAFLETNNSDIFTNCYYPYDLNRYECANTYLKLSYSYINTSGTTSTSQFNYYTNQNNMQFVTAKSNVLSMTKSSGLSGFSSSLWTYAEGLYPRLSSLIALNDNTLTQIDDSKFADEILFDSLAIHYTNAGVFNDKTYSNIFVRYDGAAFDSVSSSYLVKTYNSRMIQSNGIGTLTNEILRWTSSSDDGGTYTKTISFIPSTASCGIADYSYYFANTEGMWVTEASDEDVTIKYPWTLYTADQLNGLAALINGESDTNGLYVNNPDFSPAISEGVLGESFVLGTNIDADYYSSFRPIGTQDIPFSYTFNGLGYTISNIHLNSDTGYQDLGLFGTVQDGEILNVGVASGDEVISAATLTAGGIAAKLTGNTIINGCFSSVQITGTGDTSYAGGLVGQTSGTNNIIRASFNTGYVFIIGSNTYGGGLVGMASGLSIRNCYTAGYIEAGNYATLYGGGSAAVTNCYYDVNACGEISNTNTAVNKIPTAANLDSTVFKSFGDGIYYPLQEIYFHGFDTLNAYTGASVIPVTTGDARSVTSGYINSSISGATMNYVSSSFVGTVANLSGTVYDDSTVFTSFNKANTGLALLKVNYSGAQRYFIVNLQCWYDKGLQTGNYTINTEKELAEFAAIVNGTLTAENNPNGLHTHDVPDSFEGKIVKLGSNIDLSKLDGFSWIPVGTTANPFKGIFTGDGHVISNINITSADSGGNAALFGVIDSAEITDVGINGGTINCAATYAAGIAAQVTGGSSITGCFSSATILNAVSSGGIAGRIENGITVSKCYNMGQISASQNVGGIAAVNNGIIEFSYNVGIISSSAVIAAGIAAENNGSVNNCYNAAFINGATIYPVSGGIVVNSGYDPKLLGEITEEVSGVTNKIDFAADSNWETYTASKYPELIYFKDNSSSVMQDASELSVLKLILGSGSYNKFTSAGVASVITTNSESGDVYLSQNQSAQVFSIVLNGDEWEVEPIDAGASKLIASTSNSGVDIEHQYYVIAVITMKIRYKFDFTQLFNGSPVLDSDYHNGLYSTTNTWDSSSSTVLISTAEDFNSFISYVNSGGTTLGKKYILNYNINMNNISISTIGSVTYPFKGNFNGNGYTVSNLIVNDSGVSALFGYLDSGAEVKNLTLNNFSVIASKTNDDMYVACVAAVNKGNIINVGITQGSITANNTNFSYYTYLGTIAAYNMGKIKGCYFIQNQSIPFGIQHYSKVTDYAGGLVGMNSGTVTGCYLISNMYNANIDGLVGDNGGRTDSIINCYFNVNAGDTAPVNIEYAYDEVPFQNYFVTATMMKTDEFVKYLSSNLYAGTYERGTAENFIGLTGGTVINNGYPYLSFNQLVKYDISYYFGNNASMVFSVWNLEEVANIVTQSSNFTNGVFAVDNLDFKYFSNIITHNKLQFNMMLLPYYMDYSISSRIYGKNASFNTDINSSTYLINAGSSDVKDITSYSVAASGAYTVNETAYNDIVKPNLIVINISFNIDESAVVPWGVYRTWSSSSGQ